MAGPTKRVVAGSEWTQLVAAKGRPSLVEVDAYGAIEVAVANGKPPSSGVTGHPVTGRWRRTLRGKEIVWARGANVIVIATLLWANPEMTYSGVDMGLLSEATQGAEAARVQTGLDAIQTAADRVQAGIASVEASIASAEAQLARDAAFVNANVYPDIATGRTAVADGVQFQVLVGDEYVRYRRDSATTQTEVARYPSAAAVEARIAPATGSPGFVVTDAADNVLLDVSPTEIYHPQVVTLARQGSANQHTTRMILSSTPRDETARFIGQLSQIMVWGQSLGFGMAGIMLNRSLPETRAFQPTGGPDWRSNNADPAVSFASIEPLRKSGVLSAMQMVQQMLKDEDGIDMADFGVDFLLTSAARTGASMAELDTIYYSRFTEDLTLAKALAATVGKVCHPAAIFFAHGEADASLDSQTYLADLRAMVAKTTASVHAASGMSRPVPYFINQSASWIGANAATPKVAVDQLAAHADANICNVGPIYHLTYGDSFHPLGTDAGYGHMGAQFGVALKRWFFDGVKPNPLGWGVKAEVLGSAIVVTLPVDPGRRLVVDNTTIAAQPHYGFQVVNTAGAAQTISSAELMGRDKVVLNMAATPAAGFRVRYGWQGASGRGLGNIRDDSPLVWEASRANKPVQKWCSFFEETAV